MDRSEASPSPTSGVAKLLRRLQEIVNDSAQAAQDAPPGRSMIERGVGSLARGSTGAMKWLTDATIGNAPKVLDDAAAGFPVFRRPNYNESWYGANEDAVGVAGALADATPVSKAALLPMALLKRMGASQKAMARNSRLMPSHETRLGSLQLALEGERTSPGKALELYSPSIGINDSSLMQHFAAHDPEQVHLIPRMGAFDPANSTSALFSRDTYTPRWQGFQGRIASAAQDLDFKPLSSLLKEPLQFDTLQNVKIFNDVNMGKGPLGKFNLNPPDAFFDLPPWLRDQLAGPDGPEVLKQIFESTGPGSKQLQDSLNAIDEAIGPFLQAERLLGGGMSPKIAKARLEEKLDPAGRVQQDRPALGYESDRAPHPWIKREGAPFHFDPTTNDRDLAMALSQQRDFARYLEGDAGNLQRPGLDGLFDPVDYKTIYNDILSGSYFRPETVREMAWKPHTAGRPEVQERLSRSDAEVDWSRKNSTPSQLQKELQEAGFDARAGYKAAPSEYAELKATGPAAVTGERWAGAILPREAPLDLIDLLTRSGVPVRQASVTDKSGRYLLADELQKRAGPVGEAR